MTKNKDNSVPLADDVVGLSIVAVLLMGFGYSEKQAIASGYQLMANVRRYLSGQFRAKGQCSLFGK